MFLRKQEARTAERERLVPDWKDRGKPVHTGPLGHTWHCHLSSLDDSHSLQPYLDPVESVLHTAGREVVSNRFAHGLHAPLSPESVPHGCRIG